MLGHHLTLYHHIINIDFDAFAQLCLEHPQNHPLISGPYVLQAKRHYLVVVVPNRCHKGCFLMILQGKWYLIIALKGIQETYPRMAPLLHPQAGVSGVWGTGLLGLLCLGP